MLPKIHPDHTRARPLETAPAVSANPASALLQLAGEVRGKRVVIFSSGALNIMCSMLRKGAATATLLRQGVRPERQTADLAIAIEIGSPDRIASAIDHARRALATSGRVILVTTGDPTRRLAQAATRTLRLHGFAAVRSQTVGDRALVTGELVGFGAATRA
jgi:hypothetical protein